MNRNQEGITFVLKAFSYSGEELDRMDFVDEDETDGYEHEQEVCDFIQTAITEYRERDL